MTQQIPLKSILKALFSKPSEKNAKSQLENPEDWKKTAFVEDTDTYGIYRNDKSHMVAFIHRVDGDILSIESEKDFIERCSKEKKPVPW